MMMIEGIGMGICALIFAIAGFVGFIETGEYILLVPTFGLIGCAILSFAVAITFRNLEG